jgi:hypothetical protein
VFTGGGDAAERSAFIARLVELAGDPAAVVVVTVRADYTGHCAPYPELAELLAANLVLVGPMSAEQLRRAIELPARRVGLRVESTLVDALVAEVEDEPGGLPLLSTALVHLWQARSAGWLRYDAYLRAGGVRPAVARLAESCYEELSESERDVAISVFVRLVGQGEGEAAVRRRVPISEFDVDLDPTVASVLSKLTRDRLLTQGEGMVEIAHEALIREWPRFAGWLKDDAVGQELRGHLTHTARQWSEHGRDPGDLYRGARLSARLDWAQTHDRSLAVCKTSPPCTTASPGGAARMTVSCPNAPRCRCARRLSRSICGSPVGDLCATRANLARSCARSIRISSALGPVRPQQLAASLSESSA